MEEGQLILTILHKLIIVGGEVVPDEIYGEDLVGGTAEIFNLDPPEKLTYSLSKLSVDHDNEFAPLSVFIGEEQFRAFDSFE